VIEKLLHELYEYLIQDLVFYFIERS